MAVRSGFFNSVNGDRKYDAARFAEYFASFIGNGVFPNPSTNLQVVAQTTPDMTVIVRPGKAWINGYILINDDDYILQLDPADGVLHRIDRVVARYDVEDREIRLEIKKGTFASTPVAPALQRDADAYELALADIYVANGVISITQANITDQRLNTSLCGIVHGTVDQVDTTTLFTQYTQGFELKKDEFEQAFITWFATLQDVLDDEAAGNLLNMINDLAGEGRTTETVKGNADALAAHLAEKVHQKEIHGLRATSGKLEYYTGTEWKTVSGGLPVGNVIDFTATAEDAKVTLKWQDPPDVTIEDSEGNIITIARWAGTKILRKTGSYPVNENDGVLVVDNGIRDQYSTNGFVDTGLTNDVTYYYMAFPYTTEDVYTVDSANRVSATPRAYDDSTGSPGPKNLIAGTMQAGFFGEVSASELISGDALASLVGISQGTSQNSTAGWLKFAWQGKILFVAKKAFRNSISWDHINSANAVYGDKTVEIGGLTYKVRLLRGANIGFNPKVPIKDQPDGGNGYSGAVCHGSEWNRLMLPIHQEAINKNWAYPDNVESDIPVWAHNLGTGTQGRYTDEDLLTHNNYGSGSYSWCQEVAESAAFRVFRGVYGVSYSYFGASSDSGSIYGWRPCLEFSV